MTLYPTPLDQRLTASLANLQSQVQTLATRTMGIDSGIPLMTLPGVIDPGWVSGNPKVFVNSAPELSGPYPVQAPYVPTAGQAVILQPVQTSYLVLGPAAASSPGSATNNMAAATATISTVNAANLTVGGHTIAPQPRSGTAANSSYDITLGNSSYDITIGNSSYDIGSGTDGIGGTDTGSTGTSTAGPVAHTHPMPHGHFYGNLATDFNALRDSFSNMIPPLVAAFNALRDSFSNLVSSLPPAFNALRDSFSNLVSNYNTILAALVAAGILT